MAEAEPLGTTSRQPSALTQSVAPISLPLAANDTNVGPHTEGKNNLSSWVFLLAIYIFIASSTLSSTLHYAAMRSSPHGTLPFNVTRRLWLLLLAGIIVLLMLLAGNYSYQHVAGGFTVSPPSISNQKTEELPLTEKQFPSKIWQSWKDDSQSPTDRTVDFPHQWRVVNPDWRYERITDANIDSYVRDGFDANIVDVFTTLKDPILKADFLRYLLMLREGGVWADIDVYPHQPIMKWIPEQYHGSVNMVVGIENDHHKQPIWPGSNYSVQLSQYTILTKPSHPAFQILVDQVTENLEVLVASNKFDGGASFEDVMSSTGPFAFTKVLMDYFTEQTGIEHNGDELDRLDEPRLIGDVLVLPKDSFGWLPHEHTREKGDPAILVEHLFIGSWRAGHPG